jgi:hypothetical protein
MRPTAIVSRELRKYHRPSDGADVVYETRELDNGASVEDLVAFKRNKRWYRWATAKQRSGKAGWEYTTNVSLVEKYEGLEDNGTKDN